MDNNRLNTGPSLTDHSGLEVTADGTARTRRSVCVSRDRRGELAGESRTLQSPWSFGEGGSGLWFDVVAWFSLRLDLVGVIGVEVAGFNLQPVLFGNFIKFVF
jgi:hypothetical protein